MEDVSQCSQQAETLGIPAQQIREQPPQFQQPLGFYFVPGFYCFGNMNWKKKYTTWGEPPTKEIWNI